jgi:hypothetical protein
MSTKTASRKAPRKKGKLTLSVSGKSRAMLAHVSRRRKRSISKLVEEWVQLAVESEQRQPGEQEELSAFVRASRGKLASTVKRKARQDERLAHILSKHAKR